MTKQPSESNLGKWLIGLFALFLVGHLLVSLIRALLPLLLVVGLLSGGYWWWQRDRRLRQQQQALLDKAFYQLIQTHQGRFTILDFAMQTNLSAVAAKRYLDQQAKAFAANFEVTEHGDIFYVFATARTYASLSSLDPLPLESDSPRQDDMQESWGDRHAQKDGPQFLNQADLARRLTVSPSAISRKKMAVDFSAWTATRDPDGVAWHYSPSTQQFYRSQEPGGDAPSIQPPTSN